MVQQRRAYPACRPPGYRTTVMRATGSIIAAPDRDGLAFCDARETNAPVNIGRGCLWHGLEPASEGPNPPVRVSSLMNRRITKPHTAPGESLSGILSSKELLCAYLPR